MLVPFLQWMDEPGNYFPVLIYTNFVSERENKFPFEPLKEFKVPNKHYRVIVNLRGEHIEYFCSMEIQCGAEPRWNVRRGLCLVCRAGIQVQVIPLIRTEVHHGSALHTFFTIITVLDRNAKNFSTTFWHFTRRFPLFCKHDSVFGLTIVSNWMYKISEPAPLPTAFCLHWGCHFRLDRKFHETLKPNRVNRGISSTYTENLK